MIHRPATPFVPGNIASYDPVSKRLVDTGSPTSIVSVSPVVLLYATSLTPAVSDGLLRTCTMTGDATLHPPTGPEAGTRWEAWFTASGSNRNLTLDGAILIPSESSFTSPKTLTAGKLYILLLKYNGAAWMLSSLVGGF